MSSICLDATRFEHVIVGLGEQYLGGLAGRGRRKKGRHLYFFGFHQYQLLHLNKCLLG